MTRAQLTDKYESIEEAKSAATNGMQLLCRSLCVGVAALLLDSYFVLYASTAFLLFDELLSDHMFLPRFHLSCLSSDQIPPRGMFLWEEFKECKRAACQDSAPLDINASL